MEEEKIMYHYTYQIDNLVNDKYYRGKHSAKSLDNDYMGSGTLIKAAIDKWGIDNFKKTILGVFDTEDEAYEHEAQIITMKEVNNPMCYNLQPGGKGRQKVFTDEELKEHRAEYMREYEQQPERKEYRKEYEQQPERKEYRRGYMHEYNQTPVRKEAQRKHDQKPEVKARKHEYYLKKKAEKQAAQQVII